MSENESLSEDLKSFEEALQALAPKASGIDRDRLMFRLGELSAGQRRGRAKLVWPWQLAAAAALLVAVALGVQAVTRPNAERDVADGETPIEAQMARTGQNQSATIDNDVASSPAPQSTKDVQPWLVALASGQFEPQGVLSVRPSSLGAQLANHPPAAPVEAEVPPRRAPVFRWGDRRSWRDAVEAVGSLDSAAS